MDANKIAKATRENPFLKSSVVTAVINKTPTEPVVVACSLWLTAHRPSATLSFVIPLHRSILGASPESLLLLQPPQHARTRTHARTHARAHAHMQACTYSCTAPGGVRQRYYSREARRQKRAGFCGQRSPRCANAIAYDRPSCRLAVSPWWPAACSLWTVGWFVYGQQKIDEICLPV